MNELSTNLKTHVLITYNDSHHFINFKQNEALKNLGKDDRIEIDGSTIKGSNISEVMTLEIYYKTYPDLKPDPFEYSSQPQTNYKEMHDKIVNKVYSWSRDKRIATLKKLEIYMREHKTVGYKVMCIAKEIKQSF